MLTTSRPVVTLMLCATLAPQSFGASLTLSKPEDAGFSSERLMRIRPVVQRHIEGKDLAGAVSWAPDIYNLANASPILSVNSNYGTAAWRTPIQILAGRLLKFGVKVTF